MIGAGTAYAFMALAASIALYLVLRLWDSLDSRIAVCGALLLFGSVAGALLNAGRVTMLDTGAAFAGGALGWWVYKPSHREDEHPPTLACVGAPPSPRQVDALGSAAPSTSEGLALALHQIERRTDLTFHEASALDNKAGFVLGAASFLLLGVTGLQSVAASHRMESGIVHLVQWLAVGSVLVYLAVVSAALKAYMVHESVLAPDPRAFWVVACTNPHDEATTVLMQELLHAFTANQRIIVKKTTWTRRALRAFLAETVFLALILIAIAVTL